MSSKLSTYGAALACIGALVCGGGALAANPPTLDQLVLNVRQNSVPVKGYQVTVTQIIEQVPAVAGSEGASSISPSATMESAQFSMVYEPAAGFATKSIAADPALSAKTDLAPQAAPEEPAVKGATFRVITDFDRLLREVQKMEQVQITPDTVNGRGAYKVTAGYADGSGCDFWVDSERWYITDVIVRLQGVEFSRSSFRYRPVEGVWLPAGIDISYAADGSKVAQKYDYYTVAK